MCGPAARSCCASRAGRRSSAWLPSDRCRRAGGHRPGRGVSQSPAACPQPPRRRRRAAPLSARTTEDRAMTPFGYVVTTYFATLAIGLSASFTRRRSCSGTPAPACRSATTPCGRQASFMSASWSSSSRRNHWRASSPTAASAKECAAPEARPCPSQADHMPCRAHHHHRRHCDGRPARVRSPRSAVARMVGLPRHRARRSLRDELAVRGLP